MPLQKILKRLFVGIEISTKARSELLTFIKEKSENPELHLKKIKWIPSQNWHLTLCFLGEQNSQTCEKIFSKLKNIENAPFKIKLKDAGFFPNIKHPRVFWVGVHPVQALQKIYHNVTLILEEFISTTERKHFIPHLTLLRMRQTFPKKLLEAWQNAFSTFVTEEFIVNSIVLFSSQLTQQGARYDKELEIVLK